MRFSFCVILTPKPHFSTVLRFLGGDKINCAIHLTRIRTLTLSFQTSPFPHLRKISRERESVGKCEITKSRAAHPSLPWGRILQNILLYSHSVSLASPRFHKLYSSQPGYHHPLFFSYLLLPPPPTSAAHPPTRVSRSISFFRPLSHAGGHLKPKYLPKNKSRTASGKNFVVSCGYG